MKEADNKADHYPPITLDLEQSVIALEQGLRFVPLPSIFSLFSFVLIPVHSGVTVSL